MPPVLQAACGPTLWILLGFLLLRKMAFTVGDNTSHVGDIVLIIGVGVLLGIFVQDLDDFTTAERKDC